MSEGPPRRLIEELITRWQLTGERVVIVEGLADERFLRLVQREGHCVRQFVAMDVWRSDAVEIPMTLLARHGVSGCGAKQRVVAFAREVEGQALGDGFRGVVDKDLDMFLSVDHRSVVLLYTDHGCMDAYLWSEEVLRRVLTLFKCDDRIGSAASVRRLYLSIGAVCASLSAVRIAALCHPEWELRLHRSDKSLSVLRDALQVDIAKYVLQCRARKGQFDAVLRYIDDMRAEVAGMDPRDLMNGHDLIWLTRFALREFTSMSRRAIDEEVVAESFLTFGTMNPAVPRLPLFTALANWAAAS